VVQALVIFITGSALACHIVQATIAVKNYVADFRQSARHARQKNVYAAEVDTI
jgi:hypothetical protein